MNNPVVLYLIFYAVSAIMLLHLVLFSASLGPSDQDLLYEEKTRLIGSRPPSCHNKCNKCHPCTTIQVPALPGNDPKVRSGLTQKIPMVYIDPSPQANRYSNYKPLGWKCHCRDHLFNP